MATPEQHAVAVLGAINSVLNALSTPRHAYDLDEVPTKRPQEYVEVSVTRRFGGEVREDGTTGTTGWRIETTYVSQASVSDARVLQSKTTQALENVSLAIGGDTTTGVLFETGVPITADPGGYFSGADSWTYTL